MIRTGSSLGTNKVFFGCRSDDEDGHEDDSDDEDGHDDDCGICGDFLLSPSG